MKTADIIKHVEDGTTEFAASLGYAPESTRLGSKLWLDKVEVVNPKVTEAERRALRSEHSIYGAPATAGVHVTYEQSGETQHGLLLPRSIYGTWEEHTALVEESRERKEREAQEREECTEWITGMANALGVDPSDYRSVDYVKVANLFYDDVDVTEVQPHVYICERGHYLHLIEDDHVVALEGSFHRASHRLYIRLRIAKGETT